MDGVGVVVVAAGAGTRLGAGRPKAFVELAGVPLLERALDGVLAAGPCEVVLVVPGTHVAQAEGVLDGVTAGGRVTARVVAGGAERTHSVAAGLAALGPDVDVVLVHDAARCLTPPEVFARVVTAVRCGAAGAIPGMPVVDTIKVVDASGVIIGTPSRAGLRAVQTPQGFDRPVLEAAYASGVTATDDAALVEALGHDVVVVDGDALAHKITTADDLTRAERLLGQPPR